MFGSLKKKSLKKSILLVFILAIIFIFQVSHIYNQSQIVSTTCCSTVEKILDEYHIVVRKGNIAVVLEVHPFVTELLDVDGSYYTFFYEHNQNFPEAGILIDIMKE